MRYRRAGQIAWRLFVVAAATVIVPTSLSAEQSGVDRSVTRELTADGVPVDLELRELPVVSKIRAEHSEVEG